MKKLYYKARILDLSKLQSISLSLGDLEHSGIDIISDTFNKFLDTLKRDMYDKLKNEFINAKNNEIISLSNPIFDNIKQAINNIFMEQYQIGIEAGKDIIFEVITTKTGDLYGKELYTGLLFPIVDINKIKYKIISKSLNDAVTRDYKEIFFVEGDHSYYTNHEDYYLYNYKLRTKTYYNQFDRNFIEFNTFYRYNFVYCTIYTVTPIIDSFEHLSLCESIVLSPSFANQNEVEEYLNRFKGINGLFGSKQKFIKQITELYNKNVFNSEIEEKEDLKEVERPKIEKDSMTLKLENIEYLLAILKTKNIDAYKEFLKEYNEMISSETEQLTLKPLTIQNLTLLEGKIEIYINYAKNDINHISQLLSNLKSEYLENLQSDSERTTKLTIPDIDKINELFLKTKSQYKVKEQQSIAKDIAFLYIMEIIEDSNIKTSDLENSYFEDNLKYIMIVIMSLIENDIIESNIFIDYEAKLDLYSVFNIIRNLEIKKVKTKIKE